MSTLMLVGFGALLFLVLLLLGKALTSLELRAQERDYRQNQSRIAELEEDLDTSRRKYLIALKAEGVGKHKTSQLKGRLASVKQHLEQLEVTASQQGARQAQAQQQKLEGLVMNALGGATVRRDSQFKRVMKIIHQLVDLEKKENSNDLIAAIQEKINELGREGLIEAAEEGRLPKTMGTPVAESQTEEDVDEGVSEQEEPAVGIEKETEDAGGQAPAASGQARRGDRRDRVRDAISKRRK